MKDAAPHSTTTSATEEDIYSVPVKKGEFSCMRLKISESWW